MDLKLLLSWVLHAVALMGVAYLLPGVVVEGFWAALWAALILGLVNTICKACIAYSGIAFDCINPGPFLLHSERFDVLLGGLHSGRSSGQWFLVGCVGRPVVFPVCDFLELDPVSGKGQDRANLNLD